MIIFGVGAFGEPYRIDVDNDTLFNVIQAQQVLRKLPWSGEMFIPLKAEALGSCGQHYFENTIEAVITKTTVWVRVSGPEEWENILDPDDSLLSIPDVYVSKAFEYGLNELVFTLSTRDIDLMERWKANKAKKLRKSQNFSTSKLVKCDISSLDS